MGGVARRRPPVAEEDSGQPRTGHSWRIHTMKDCFTQPAGTWVVSPEDEDTQVVGTDSAMLAVADPLHVEKLLSAVESFVDGRDVLPATGALGTDAGFLIDTGGDGAMDFGAYVVEGHAHAIHVDFGEEHSEYDRWLPGGIFQLRSGALLLGDPSNLDQHVADPFSAPFQSYGVWAMFSLPGPGWIALHILKQEGRAEGRSVALRVDWVHE